MENELGQEELEPQSNLEVVQKNSDLVLYTRNFYIVQDLILGYSIAEVTAKHQASVEEVVELMKKSPHLNTHTSETRKAIALARLDVMTKALMPRASEGDTNSIHTYLKIQEREAKLLGMDKPAQPTSQFVFEIPWLSQDRLAYKNEKGVAIDNVTDITPIIAVKQAIEQSASEPPAPAPPVSWKPEPESSALRLKADIKKLSEPSS